MKCCQSTRKSSDCSRPKPSLRSWECQATPKRSLKARGTEKCSWGARGRELDSFLCVYLVMFVDHFHHQMYHQYWKSPFRKGFVWSPASWSPSINGWGCPLVLVNDEMRICIPWRNWGKPQENWTLYVELGKDITLHDVHKALPKLFIRSFQIPAVRIGWRSM